MIDETGRDTAATSGERVGFCQDCGRPLTRETVRPVGSGIFCEPCLEARIGATAPPGYVAGQAVPPAGGPAGAGPAWTATGNAGPGYTAGYTGYTPPISAVPVSSVPGEPSPFLAGLLGLIPGVGAMYNGQYAKGVVHFVIFFVLVAMSKDIGIFSLCVLGWVIYQVIEAYHTAQARRDGLPLPNAFGFNDIGDRMGFGRNWPGSASRPVGANGPWAPFSAPTATTPGPGATIPVAPPPVPAADWAGYVPPTEFGAAAAAQQAAYAQQQAAYAAHMAAQTASDIQAQAYRDAAAGVPPHVAHGPYTAQVPYADVPLTADPVAAAVPAGRRFPMFALVLIGLGGLFLLADFDSAWHVSGRWLVPAILAAFSVWLLTRRMRWLGDRSDPARWACIVRWPVMLFVLAVLFALQAANLLTMMQTWPVLFIVFGALVLVERLAGRADTVPVGYAAPPVDGSTAARWAAASAGPGSAAPGSVAGNDTPKGGA